MRLSLIAHPSTLASTLAGRIEAVEVEVERAGPSGLSLAYRLTGDPGALVVPPPAAPVRTDGLWRSTCFEAFVRSEGEARYFEFNLAPSTQWAAYGFERYREGMAPLEIAPPQARFAETARGCELDAVLALPSLAALPWRLALCAVIEARDGTKSYWALAHPPGRPDFHHDAGFVARLPAAPGRG